MSFPQRQHKSQELPFFIPDLCQAQAVFFLVLVAELLAAVLVIVDVGLRKFDWLEFALQSLYVQWVVLLSAAILCRLRNWLASQPTRTAATISYLIILIVIVVSSLLAQLLMASAFFGASDVTIDYWRVADHVLISAVFAGITLRYFFLTHQLQIRQQAALSLQLDALQARIRPHFLFNSMNSIASLISIDPLAAEKSIEDLSDLFRASISQNDSETTLSNELDICRGYVRIEKWRLGHRLQLNWQIDERTLALSIPSLTLQPLIENAIYHGIESRAEGGIVDVIASFDGEYLQIEVRNPLPDEKIEKDGNHIALVNIRERLRALYGDDAKVVAENKDGYFVSLLRYKPNKLP